MQGSQNPARPRLSLVLCTDGLVEVFDGRDDRLGVEGFARLILDSAKLPLPEMRQAVLGGVAMPRHGPSPTMCTSSSSKFASSVGVVSVCKRLDFLRRIKTANTRISMSKDGSSPHRKTHNPRRWSLSHLLLPHTLAAVRFAAGPSTGSVVSESGEMMTTIRT